MIRTTTLMMPQESTTDTREFYLACRNGDVEFVKDYLTKLPDNKWNPNHFESGAKSTPLHAACFYGHKEIVQLLLEHGCDRSQLNSHGLTAYEEAANDEIRQLFKRPTAGSHGHRFRDETTHDCFDIVKRPKECTEEAVVPAAEQQSKTKKRPTVIGYGTKAEKRREVGYATTSIAMCQSKLGRFITDRFQRDAPMSLNSIANKLQEVIDREISGKKDPQSEKANELLKKYINDSDEKCIEHLIKLYTLETGFYHGLKQNPMPLALPMYMASHTLKDRYFQGESYRGAKIDADEIASYEWGVKNHGSLLQTRHFSSTSLNRSVAIEFSTGVNKKKNDQRSPALFIFNFPKKCNQAINLGRISDQQPGLSEFEDEAEVLILPWTLFQVDSVEKESPSSPSSPSSPPSPPSYTIRLTNVPLPRKSILSSVKWILTHPKGSIERFHEHFPEKQPETVVSELMNSLHIPDEDDSHEKD